VKSAVSACGKMKMFFEDFPPFLHWLDGGEFFLGFPENLYDLMNR